MKDLWPKFLGDAIVLFACFFGALIALTPHYSLWTLLAVVGVCITGAIGVTGAVYGLVNARVLARKRDALGEDDLKKIAKISAEPGRTWAQKRLSLSPYFKKWIVISGVVGDVGAWAGRSSRVEVETGVAGLTAYMTFTNKRKYQKPLSTVDPGQTLTVIGRDRGHRLGWNIGCEMQDLSIGS